MSFSLGPRLDFRQTQSLVMTPQLRQAIKLLQSSNMEVVAFVEEELERNPLLERDEGERERPGEAGEEPGIATAGPGGEAAADLALLMPTGAEAPLDLHDTQNLYEASEAPQGPRGGGSFEEDERGIDDLAVERPRSLREELAEQARLSFHTPQERLIAGQLIALLDPAGRLSLPDAAIAGALGCAEADVAAVRARMQRFEPVGLFARDLAECLAAQLAEKNRLDPAMQALLQNLELLARRDMPALLRICGVDMADLAEMVAEIRRLDPKPGASFDGNPAPTVVPDVLMRRGPDGGWLLELNPETLPRVLVNRGFHAAAHTTLRSREDRAFLAERLQSANWLVKSLEQRANTILKVSAEIVRRQDGFFRHGIAHLRPLILRDVAEEVEMHESTVSRVTANKYIATPRGTFELKFFFTTAIAGTTGETFSAEAIRHRIRDMIGAERSEEILSDDAIVERLRSEGVDIARRTVAKYREALRIPSSVQRKREKAVPAF
ncbi:RNA polymerase factor sigma-54 [Roseomonas sp. OT10]|uniref:RNA polymerase factor sigma-54 n=1 Tax=Roseomonas cutis TaxID=2897332 RepID=UPI001E4E79F9|nr:RNA polymerase factor sigma-54 [Roseomonas sp. OT10]UFN47394.1 RNA polymerase factor sigma-54 [Roseomonas sp. OT10]